MAFGRVAIVGDAAFVARPHVGGGRVEGVGRRDCAGRGACRRGRGRAGAASVSRPSGCRWAAASSSARGTSAPICRRRRPRGARACRALQHGAGGDRGDGAGGFSGAYGSRPAQRSRSCAADPAIQACVTSMAIVTLRSSCMTRRELYSPSSFFALPPQIAAVVAASKPVDDHMLDRIEVAPCRTDSRCPCTTWSTPNVFTSAFELDRREHDRVEVDLLQVVGRRLRQSCRAQSERAPQAWSMRPE